MRYGSLQNSRRLLARGAAIVLVGGMAAGCSSGVSRFTDDIFTGSTPNQRQIIDSKNQPFPGATAQAPASPSGAYSESAARGAVEPAPVQRTSLPPVASTPVARAETPRLDTTPTGTVQATQPVRQVAAVKQDVRQGWSRDGGTPVTIRSGETLNTLSNRYGVPVNAIMKANGIADANSVSAGQQVIIPTYVHSSQGRDTGRQAADTSTSRGPANDLPLNDVPRPGRKPDNVAVLPQQPKVKTPEVAAATTGNSDASAAPKSSRQIGYTVVSGDSLYGIAKKTGARAADIRKANNLGETANLKIGQTLIIPGTSQVARAPAVDPVVTGATGPAKKADNPQAEKLATYTPPKAQNKAIRDAEAASDDEAPNSTGIGKMRWPVRGRVVGTYGNSAGASFNDGIDIAVPEGTPVKAAENGVVIFAGEGLKDFGKTVLVRHADGKVTVYGHTSEIKVSRGDTVKRGQEIAKSGMSGSTDTPKLHFEVRENSNPVDPQQFLE